MGASPQNELEGSLPPASVKTEVGGWPQPRLGAGRADKESVLGDAAPALNTGPQTMELRHLTYFVTDAGAALFPEAHRVLRQAEAARLAAGRASDRPLRVLRIGAA